MKLSRLFVLSLSVMLFFAWSVPKVMANEWNQATKITFSAPVEVPGKVLPAGTYWFKLLSGDPDRNIVQIFTADRMHVLATILTVPDYRFQPKGRTVVKFEERPSRQPEALEAWFYPGDNYGHSFVYPESRASELAKRTGRPVLSMPNEEASNITKPANSTKDESVIALKKAHVTAMNSKGEETSMAKVVQAKGQGMGH